MAGRSGMGGGGSSVAVQDESAFGDPSQSVAKPFNLAKL